MRSELSSRPLLDTRPDGDLFVDRKDEIKQILRIARSGLNAIIFGERGIGKTSFLRRVQYQLRQADVDPIYIDGALPDDALDILELVRYHIGGTRRRTRSVMPPYMQGEEVASEPEQLLRAVRVLGRVLGSGPQRTILLDTPTSSDAHTLFGRLRDELWRLPLQWIITADDDRRWQYLQPPADAFFEHVVDLGPLSAQATKALLEKRIEKPTLSHLDISRVIELSKGHPRQAITLTRVALDQSTDSETLDGDRAELQRRLAELGRAASMLVSEMEALGPVSASDERLLKRLGWTRPRAVQVLKQLELKGLVTSSDEVSDTSGRPRKVYSLVQKVIG